MRKTLLPSPSRTITQAQPLAVSQWQSSSFLHLSRAALERSGAGVAAADVGADCVEQGAVLFPFVFFAGASALVACCADAMTASASTTSTICRILQTT